jgi:NADPH:quinone reductase-like Zn-dependent oxidoreductase
VDFTEAVRDVDVVLDIIGGDNGPRSLSVLRPHGTFVTAVDRANTALADTVRAAGFRFIGVAVEPDGEGLGKLTELVEAGRVHPHIERVHPLTDIARAHEQIESGHTTGKIVVTTDG